MDNISSCADYKVDSNYIYDHSGFRIKKFGKGEVRKIIFKHETLRNIKQDIISAIIYLLFVYFISFPKLSAYFKYMASNKIPWQDFYLAPESIQQIFIITVMSVVIYLFDFIKIYQIVIELKYDTHILKFNFFAKKEKIINFIDKFENYGWTIEREPNLPAGGRG
jgi:hypothetical protein